MGGDGADSMEAQSPLVGGNVRDKKTSSMHEEEEDVVDRTEGKGKGKEAEPTLILFVNYNSGGKMGYKLQTALNKQYDSANIYNLGVEGPRNGLEKHRETPNLRVGVCGGDGTINWVLSIIDSMNIVPRPAIGLIPLGTGNDAARAFGWGHKFVSVKGIMRSLAYMQRPQCDIVNWDRWHIAMQQSDHVEEGSDKGFLPAQHPCIATMDKEPLFFSPSLPSSPSSPPDTDALDGDTKLHIVSIDDTDDLATVKPSEQQQQLFQAQFQNYMSFGCDAQTLNKFHHARENCRCCFVSRLCNMAWMGLYGFVQCCCCQARKMDLVVLYKSEEQGQWKELEIPNGFTGIVILNLKTYAGGRNIWGSGKSNPKKKEYGCDSERKATSVGDGMLEILGIENACHLTCMVAEMRRGRRLAQAVEIRVQAKENVYVQLDGEPWLDECQSNYHLRRLVPARMIVGPKKHTSLI